MLDKINFWSKNGRETKNGRQKKIDASQKMLGNLVVWPANKENLIPRLQQILTFNDFCGQESPDTERTNNR